MDRPRPPSIRLHRRRCDDVVCLRKMQSPIREERTGRHHTRLATFIGVAELAGGLGIVLPMATNITPSLSLWAAVGLSTIMLLAIGFHLRRHESPIAPGILFFLLAVFVVFGRFSHWR
jgi:DoxX-like family